MPSGHGRRCASIDRALVSIFDEGSGKACTRQELLQCPGGRVFWALGWGQLHRVSTHACCWPSPSWGQELKKPLPPTLSPSSPLLRRPNIVFTLQKKCWRECLVFTEHTWKGLTLQRRPLLWETQQGSAPAPGPALAHSIPEFSSFILGLLLKLATLTPDSSSLSL